VHLALLSYSHKYKAKGPVNNPLAAEIAQLNKKKNTSLKDINLTELLKQNRLKEEKKYRVV